MKEPPAVSMADSARWLECFRSLASGIQDDTESDDIIDHFLQLICEGAQATGALLFLESPGDHWLCEASVVVEGAARSSGALGLRFETSAEALSQLRRGVGLIADSEELERPWARAVGLQGPLQYIPVSSQAGAEGVAVLWRSGGAEPFDQSQLHPAEAFASQAALALDLIEAKQSGEHSAMAEERERIGRDLHDLAIQGLFATGMRLRSVQDMIAQGATRHALSEEVAGALEGLDDSVMQIRAIVNRLRQQEREAGLVDRLRREASNARSLLGFAPTLVVKVDGRPLSTHDEQELVSNATEPLADDVVAVVREALANIARHAKAASTIITVSVHGTGPAGEIVVSVLDDGSGVNPTTTRESGLSNMQRRATMHGGSFALGAGPRGRGTSLIWRVPLT